MKTLTTILITFLSVISCFGQSCEIDGTLYSTFLDVQTILDNNNCNSCHGSISIEGNWNYETYESFATSGNCGQPVLVHGNASQSYFYGRLTTSEDLCGESDENHKMSATELDQIESWINYGAPEFCLPLYADIKTLLDESGCQTCHSANAQSWSYQSYTEMISSGNDDNCGDISNITKSSANLSLLYDKVNNDGSVACGDVMEGSNAPLSYEEIANIRDWINGGAPNTSSTLPVVLSLFEAKIESKTVVLNWKTEVEIATDKFILERSPTGKNFIKVAELPAEGSTNITTEYSIIDNTPLAGDNYYRLRILDLDGSYDYSNIRLVRVESTETTISVSPNPAMSNERLIVKWNPLSGQDQTKLNIVDVNGQNLHRKIIFEGTNYVRLPVLLDGVYYIIVEDYFGGILLERIVIIN